MQAPFFMRRTLILNLLVLAVLPSFAAAANQPNVILITLDTFRADRMGFLGAKLGLTPQLDALASQSVVFEHAYSQAPITPVSHATILTGTFPQYHGIRNFGDRLPPTVPFLPEILHAHGYHTGDERKLIQLVTLPAIFQTFFNHDTHRFAQCVNQRDRRRVMI